MVPGKTTLALEYSSQSGVTYIGADAIAESISPGDPVPARLEAGKRFLTAVDEHLSRHESLVVETTLSGRTFRHTIATAKQRGFTISIAYLFLESADTCIARVEERVRKGGHDVPDSDVRRRFGRSLTNFWTIYRQMADTWVLLYNGGGQLQDVAAGSHHSLSIRDTTMFNEFIRIIGTSAHE